VAAFLLILGLSSLWSRQRPAARPFLAAALLLALAYVTFMCTVDIPMYVSRLLADGGHGREYMSLRQGAWDVTSRWIITHSWDHWHAEIPWMTLYFSVGVWCSIALAHGPRFESSRPLANFGSISQSA